MVAAVVELDDLQGNILCGYGHCCARYTFLHFTGAEPARRLVGALTPRVRSAASWGEDPPASTLNVAFTWDGLRALGVPEVLLESFPEEFRAGMAARAPDLGDRGESAVECWHPELVPGALHALVTVYGLNRKALRVAVGALADDLAGAARGVKVAHTVDAALLKDQREHFGFRDGFSQPQIRDAVAGPNVGEGTPLRFGRWRDVEPGEFVLGYDDEDGGPPAAPGAPLDRNASFMVVRKLRQHVDRFTAFVRDHAGPDLERQKWLKAKIVGRWPNGAPLVERPDHPGEDDLDASELIALNAFRYGGDRDGMRCPVGAHIRRANPRDGLGWQGRLTKRHRIVRRGMPYGPPPADPAVDDGEERGLMFVCFQASIARQFEVVQGRWLNDGDAFGLGDDRDFLVGLGSSAGKMTVPGDPPGLLRPQPDFVTTRGGDYFFAPSLTALEWLAALDGRQRP
jgi:Dyp-type peroxidase family